MNHYFVVWLVSECVDLVLIWEMDRENLGLLRCAVNSHGLVEMDIFVTAREFLHEIYPLSVYVGMLVAYVVAWHLMPKAKKMTLFVWVFGFPITVFIFIFFIKTWPPIPLSRYGFLVYGVFLAQFGWLGALLSVISYFTHSRKMSSAAFWISALPVSLHIAVLSLLLVSGSS